tara:strand:+ start:568 stop:873 length:306 start_codon:yes stop_codon:yes gene_type:complete
MTIQPKLSFDKESQKPLFVNESAVMECLKMLKGEASESDFLVDEGFLKYYERETDKKDPTQEEINGFVKSLIVQCAKHEPNINEASEFYLDGDKIRKNADS